MSLYTACATADPKAGWNEYYPNEEIFIEDVQERTLFICEVGNETIGAFSLHQTDEIEEMGLRFTHMDKPCIISRLCVLPSMQGKGYGRGILHSAQNEAKRQEYGCIHLLCDVLNDKANQLYLSEGYFEVTKVDLYGNRYHVLERGL